LYQETERSLSVEELRDDVSRNLSAKAFPRRIVPVIAVQKRHQHARHARVCQLSHNYDRPLAYGTK
jgi:hypothetical protein